MVTTGRTFLGGPQAASIRRLRHAAAFWWRGSSSLRRWPTEPLIHQAVGGPPAVKGREPALKRSCPHFLGDFDETSLLFAISFSDELTVCATTASAPDSVPIGARLPETSPGPLSRGSCRGGG